MTHSHRAAWLAFLLSFAYFITGTEVKESLVLPKRAAPVGVMNENGICYLAAIFQVLEAIRMALGTEFEQILNGSEGLLGAYNCSIMATRMWPANVEFTRQFFVIDPEEFSRAIVAHSTERSAICVVERVMKPGQKVQVRDITPIAPLASGGDPLAVMRDLDDEIAEQYMTRGQANPFVCTFTTAQGDKRGQGIFAQAVFTRAFICDEHYRTASCSLEECLPVGSCVVEYPKILMLTNTPDEHQCVRLPLFIEMNTLSKPLQYQLLGIIYGFPVFNFKDEGFKIAHHAIALIRYGVHWFICDNHLVTPIPSTDALLDWIEHNAYISYAGPAMERSGLLKRIVPMLAVYELMQTETVATEVS